MEVYFLRPGSSGALEQIATPEIRATVTPELNNFHFTPTKAGVYAIVVTAYDAAGNSARARKIFNYDDKPGFQETDEPVRFSGPQNNSLFFTTDSERKATLTWAGRFIPKNEEFSRRVEAWPIDQNTIDDVYANTFGLRSISAINGPVGVNSMSCVFRIESTNTGDQPEVDDGTPEGGAVLRNCSTDLESQTATLELAGLSIRNGDTVVVTLNASDYSENTFSTVTAKATLDETRPDVSVHEFVPNRDDGDYSL